MQLRAFIKEVGDDKAAKLFRVPVRTIRSWRHGARRPRAEKAQEIVKKSPVTMEGIYGA